jgi:tetratricopeptide (TPR) repeat protein
MISTLTVSADVEPTSEFEDRCRRTVDNWASGHLPYKEVLKEIAGLTLNAIYRNHSADQGRVEQVIGQVESQRGNLNAGNFHFERARSFYVSVGNSTRAALCDIYIGNNYRDKGDFRRALSLYEKASEAFKATGDVENEALALGCKGQALLSRGKFAAAYADLRGCLDLAGQFPSERHDRNGLLCEVHHALAQLCLRRKWYGVAWDHAVSAYELALEHPTARARGFAERAVAEVLTTAGAQPFDRRFVDDPDVYYQAASSAFKDVHAEGEIARTLFMQALSMARRGRKMAAARKLQHAMIIFTRLGMVYDAAQAAQSQLEVM